MAHLSALLIAAQAYNEHRTGNLDSKVLIQIRAVYDDGEIFDVGTDALFQSWNADAYFSPSCCASGYSSDPYQPHENMDARAEQIGCEISHPYVINPLNGWRQ